MKRKIKYRGKCAGAWRKGDHLTYANGEVIKQWSGSLSPEYTVEPETVGQFTGAYDVDGKEIYEGDILKDANGEIFVVYYEGYSWLAGLPALVKGAGLYDCNLEDKDLKTCKVIGNIFDSPELIERGDTNESE